MSAEAVQDAIIQHLRNDVDISPEFNVTLTGTLTFTQSSSAVAGVGTLFPVELKVGDYIRAATSTVWYKVATIASNTALTLEIVFAGTTEAGVVGKVSNIARGMGRNLVFKDDTRAIRVYLPTENWSRSTVPNIKQDVVYPFLLFVLFYEPDEDLGEKRKTAYNQLIRKAIDKNLLLGGIIYDSRMGDTRYYFHPMIEGSYYMVIPFMTKKREVLN